MVKNKSPTGFSKWGNDSTPAFVPQFVTEKEFFSKNNFETLMNNYNYAR